MLLRLVVAGALTVQASQVTTASRPRAPYIANCVSNPNTALPQTIERIRKNRASGSISRNEIVHVSLVGTCSVAHESLTLEKGDSHIHISGGTISGGIDIPDAGWYKSADAKCPGCGSIWATKLPNGTLAARQLWVNGVRANRTKMRFPGDAGTKSDTGINTTIGANWTRAHRCDSHG